MQGLIARLRSVLVVAGVDRAGIYGASGKIWSLVTGPITLAIVATALSPEAQGYYFAFAGILALQVLAEFGLGNVIIPVASHEWAGLRVNAAGEVAGDSNSLSRLRSLTSFVSYWYGIAGASAVVILATIGWWFFSNRPEQEVVWRGPWLAVCITTGLSLWAQGYLYLLEGCNQTRIVYQTGLVAGVLSAIGTAVVLLMGGGLWSTAVPGIVRGACVLVISLGPYKLFWRSIASTVSQVAFDWRTEVWPLQWRIGVSWLAGYCISAFLNPAVFQYVGPEAAGRFGMSMALANSVPWIGYALVQPRTASFGGLIASHQFEALDRLFLKLCMTTMLVAGGLTALVLLGVVSLNILGLPYAARMLPPFESSALLITATLRCVLQLQSRYLRSHKAEPLMTVSILAGLVSAVVGLSATRAFGVRGAVLSYLAVTTLFELPICTAIFFSKRRQYRLAYASQL